MLLTVFLSIVILAAVTVMMLSAVAFIQDERMFSSAPEEVRKLIRPRKTELFYGARTIGWTLLIFSILMIIGALVIAAWGGIRACGMDLQFALNAQSDRRQAYEGSG